MDRLDEILHGYEQEMVTTLKELVRIPSVDGEPKPNMPFGENCYRVLHYALQKAESFGFTTLNDDNYAGHVQLGSGEKKLGILAHLDVVPEGTDWTVPPYEAVEKDGYLYGRGVSDNKNSCVSCLYALRAIKEAGIPLRDTVLLIMGCNEEKGSEDMKHYMEYVGMPDYGFSPDSGFPVCYAEKGIHRVELYTNCAGETPILSITAGQAVNIVPNRCSAHVKGDENTLALLTNTAKAQEIPCKAALKDGVIELEVEGVASHGAHPEGGRNAISLMVRLLCVLPLGCMKPAMDLLHETLDVADWDGQKLGIAMVDEPSGALTVNLGLLRADSNGMVATLDIRQPVTADFQQVLSNIRDTAAKYCASARSIHISEPLYVPKDSPLVQTLMKVYKEQTGLDTPPFSMGGGTYARTMKNAVAFGPGLPDSKSGGCHGPDEKLYIEELFTAARIYAHTIVALAGENQ